MANPLNFDLSSAPTPPRNLAPSQQPNWVVIATQPTFSEMKSGSQPLTVAAPSNHAGNVAQVAPRRVFSLLEPSSWVKFAHDILVYAPNPFRNDQICLGKMIEVDRNVVFDPLDSPDESVSYIKIDFEYGTASVTGNNSATVYRGFIWPVQ